MVPQDDLEEDKQPAAKLSVFNSQFVCIFLKPTIFYSFRFNNGTNFRCSNARKLHFTIGLSTNKISQSYYRQDVKINSKNLSTYIKHDGTHQPWLMKMTENVIK